MSEDTDEYGSQLYVPKSYRNVPCNLPYRLSSCVSVASGVSPLWGDEKTDGTEKKQSSPASVKTWKTRSQIVRLYDKIEVITRFLPGLNARRDLFTLKL
ncbi:hypothetical protein FOXB_15456 [Fusarium oxysporum f. sp. conglutinans Fo5176]|uniref:Uncharacterized protein n=1 Tax=Fusarium oxysporum (strain Fo5176) TaxID=660025 RepID=F9G9X4_FUSOF|nr:hypothetical protein FOXB_15456 [Fusarium oxysporum f. sp. conglutinans Fo5176]